MPLPAAQFELEQLFTADEIMSARARQTQAADEGSAAFNRICPGTPWSENAETLSETPNQISQMILDTLDAVMPHRLSEEQRERVAALNDKARTAMGVASIVETTPGFRGLSADDQSRIKVAVKNYDLWHITESDDATRDFGVIFKHADGAWSQETPPGGDPIEAIFWKILCLDHSQTCLSMQPWDETRSLRVLLLMLATEY